MPFAPGNLEAGLFSRSQLVTMLAPSSLCTNTFWEGAPLGANDYVISADEKSSIQARRRKQPNKPSGPARCASSVRLSIPEERLDTGVRLEGFTVRRPTNKALEIGSSRVLTGRQGSKSA
jgi:hypothetical protein